MTQSSEPFDPYYHWLGIPPDEQPPNHYRLLGINRLEENREVIQNAADRQMAHLRTFQTGPHAALSQKLLNEVSAARICLMSAEKKRAYDQLQFGTVAAAFVPAPPVPSPPTSLPPAASQLGGPAIEDSTPDVFEESALDSLFVQTTGSAPVGKPAKRVYASPRSRVPGILAAAVGLALVGAIWVAIRKPAADDPLGSQNRLVLMWPAAERSEALLEIDGRPCDLTTAAVITGDQVELDLEPGAHTYRIVRPGRIPLEGSFSLSAGTSVELNIAFAPLPETTRLVLHWPEEERSGATLEIDGRVADLAADSVSMDAERVVFSLPSGQHTLSIQRDGTTLLSQTVTLGEIGQVSLPIALSSTRLYVRWDVAKREHATLLLDGAAVDLQRDPASDRDGLLVFNLPLGKHTLRIERDGALLIDESLELTAGKRTTVNANSLMDQSAARVWLVWPAAQRVGATLQVDGKEVTLTQDPAATNETEYAVDVEPGDHTVRITHPDFEDFEESLTNVRGEVRLNVSRKPLMASRPSAEELARLREEFESAYVQYDEYKQWQAEADPLRKRPLLDVLLERIRATASTMPRASAEQSVAYQAAYRLAVTHDALAVADVVLKSLRQSGCCTEQEYEALDQEVWDKAIRESGIDALPGFLKARGTDGRKLTDQEQSLIVERAVQSPQVESDYPLIEQAIGALLDIDALSPAAAAEARVRVFVAAAKGVQPVPERYLTLGETMIALVPEVLTREAEASFQQADDLMDAVNVCRRKVLADRRTTDELKERAETMNNDAKDMRDLISQSRRAAEARQAIEANTGTAAQRKLLGLWLLQRGQYDEALPHLQQSGDSALVDISASLPESANELLTLAEAIELESKKSKYSKRNESAFLGYALHLRQLALAKSDGTLDEDTRSIVERRVGGPVEELEWRRWPKGKWTKLLDIYTIETLREIAQTPQRGKWNVLSDGTIVATLREPSMLEIPVNLQGSYAIRFTCRRTAGDAVNVNLPLGDRSVLFTVGAFSDRYCGLQLVDGKWVNDPENGAAIKRSEFAMRRDVPVRVELHVELLPARVQSAKQKKLTGGNDWATISILLEGRLLRRVSAATSRFSMDTNYQLSHDVLGFSANAVVTYGNIELMRL